MSSSSSSSSSSQALRIFSPAEWKNLYSDEDYKKTERVQPHLFHFLIARGHAQDDLISRINTAKYPDKLIAHDPKNHALTPLIIAAMSGNERIIEELLKQDLVKKNINDTDEYGWTALHHAALTSDTIFQKLVAAGAKANLLTKLKGTPADLRALTAPESKNTTLQSVSFEGKALTQEVAQKTFGLTYRDPALFPSESLKGLWKQKPEPEEPVANYAIEHPTRRFPKVEIVAIDKEKGFYGLVAGEDIPAGTLFGEYGGSFRKEHQENGFTPFSPENGKNDAYLFKGFDARAVGNATRFINSGFSNIAPLPKTENGVNRFVFLNPTTIKKGEPLLFNYGANAQELTYGQQTLFNREKTHAFFRKGLNAIEKEIDAADEKIKKSGSMTNAAVAYLGRMDVRDHACFPLDNPACLIDLHASGIVPAAQWIKPIAHVNELLVNEWLLSRGVLSYTRIFALALRLTQLDRAMEQKEQGSSAVLRNWLKEHCQSYKVVDLVKAMEWIAEDPKCVDKIDERLKSYDWTKDESNLYSYKNRCAAFERQLNLDLLKGATDPSQLMLTFSQKRREQLQETRQRLLATNRGFPGSELERMLNEIEASTPNDLMGVMGYVAGIGPELAEITSYCH